MLRERAGGEAERPQHLHHRREAALLLLLRIGLALVAAECEQALQLAAVSTSDLVVEIPARHAQRLALIEAVVRIGRLEGGEPEQTLVHHRDRVGHRAALLLLHAQAHLAVGAPQRRRFDHRLEHRRRVEHEQRHHAVEADGPVVVLAGEALVWLDQRQRHVGVGRHAGGDGNLDAGLAGREFDPALLQHLAAGLDAQQRAAGAGIRQLHDGGLAGLVLRLVGEEIERGGARAGLVLRAAGPARPFGVEHLAGAVAALGVADAHQIAAPVRRLDLEAPGGAAVGAGADGVAADQLVVGAGLEVGEAAGLVALPPPAPVDAVQAHGQCGIGDRLAGGVEHGEGERLRLVHQHHARALRRVRQLEAGVARIGVVGLAAEDGAVGAAVLEDAGGELGFEPRRRLAAGLGVEFEAGLAGGVERAFEHRLRLALIAARRVFEHEALVALEAQRCGAQTQADVGLQARRRRAVQPGGIERGLGG